MLLDLRSLVEGAAAPAVPTVGGGPARRITPKPTPPRAYHAPVKGWRPTRPERFVRTRTDAQVVATSATQVRFSIHVQVEAVVEPRTPIPDPVVRRTVSYRRAAGRGVQSRRVQAVGLAEASGQAKIRVYGLLQRDDDDLLDD